jgi:uncharacterized protein
MNWFRRVPTAAQVAAWLGVATTVIGLPTLVLNNQPAICGTFGIWCSSKTSADQESLAAQLTLASNYYIGDGTAKNVPKAIELYTTLAEGSSSTVSRAAQFALAMIYKDGAVIRRDEARAFALMKKSADQGFPAAQVQLGNMYIDADVVTQDIAEAAALYRKAADQGDADGQWHLAELYKLGQGVPQDYAKAIALYGKSADQGNAIAQGVLGYMYDNGIGVSKDAKKAFAFYRTAANHDAEAQFQVGLAYEHGRGVQKNLETAISWYETAGRNGYSKATESLKRLGRR